MWPTAATSSRQRPGVDGVSLARGDGAVPVCAKIELEIAALEAADAPAFLADLGLKESGLDRVIRASYDLLGYMSFFTVGEDECRAWSIPRGTVAQEAAGEIHSDIARGFIRAEVVPYECARRARHDGRVQGARRVRLEGKVHRQGRRHHQLPLRHIGRCRVPSACLSVKRRLPLVRGGAELLVRQLVSELRRAASRPIACRCPSSGIRRKRSCRTRRRGVCSISAKATGARSIWSSRPSFPPISRAPAQGLLARAPAPRGLRAVRHLLQRLRRRRNRRRTARSADGARRTDARRVRGLYTISRTVSSRLRNTTALRRRRSTIRRSSRRACTRRNAAHTCCRSRGSRRTSASISRSVPSPTCRRICARRRRRRQRSPRIEQAAEETGAADRDDLCRRGQRHRARRALRDALCLVYAPFDEDYGLATLEAFLAEKPVIGSRLRRHARVRHRRRQRLRRRADPEAMAAPWSASTPIADGRVARRAGRDLAASISWDAVIERLLSHG